jgi:integrase
MAAVKYFDYRYLDDVSRKACIQLFRNRGWTLPPALINSVENHGAAEELTLFQAIDYALSDPELQNLADPTRTEQALSHAISYWGLEYPVGHIKVRQIKEYMQNRKKEGAAAATVNRERSALSKMFGILMQADYLDRNPVKETLPADGRDGQRDAYISLADFERIIEACSPWTRSIFQTLYYTGMRRGEALNLTWNQVNLPGRMIVLGHAQTKERRGKRVPVHKLLVPILEEIKTRNSSDNDQIFLNDKGGPPYGSSLTRVWRTAVKACGFDPRPTVHDLRHTWKTNAMRSGVHPAIADMIVGHGNRKKDIQSLYLSVSDADLLEAIDKMTFDHGETKIWVMERGKE